MSLTYVSGFGTMGAAFLYLDALNLKETHECI